MNGLTSFASSSTSRRRLVSLTARVERDGEWRVVPQRDIVVGDLIRLVAGYLAVVQVVKRRLFERSPVVA